MQPARQCPYCSRSCKGGTLKRHVTKLHKKELEEIKKNGKDGTDVFLKVRNLGILKHNKEVAAETRHDYVAIRRCGSDIVHCQGCGGSYAKTYFYRHRAHCGSRKPGTAAVSVSAKLVHLDEDESYKMILDSFRNDDIGQVCREDKTIRQMGRLLWQKDRTKVDKSDEVRKTVMTSMRTLAKLFIEMRQHLTDVDASKVDASALFNRANWTALTAAIDVVTSGNSGGTVKYGLKNTIFYLLMSSAYLLEGVALTSVTSDEVATEMANFKKVLKHHENSIFSDAKYLINKSRQEKLRLPTRTPPEEAIERLRHFTVASISKGCQAGINDRQSFVHVRNLVCSRLTLFNARRGGEPSRMTMDQWLKRDQWLAEGTVDSLAEEEKLLFSKMSIMYMTGKGNHLVTCLVPKDAIEAMDLLCKVDVRLSAGVATGNKFVFPNTEDSLHHWDGWHATHYVLGKAGIKCSAINATNQRGRISTMYASFDVAEEDRGYFFKHLGHSQEVNVGTYQRPLPVKAITKVGAILLNIDERKQHHCPGNTTGHNWLEYWPNEVSVLMNAQKRT